MENPKSFLPVSGWSSAGMVGSGVVEDDDDDDDAFDDDRCNSNETS